MVLSTETLQTLINLLAKTEGRDKLIKTAGGTMAVVASFTGAVQHQKMSASLSESRTLMRFVLWLKNIQTLANCPKKTLGDYLWALRVFFDLVYCMHDNLKYLTKYGLINPAPLATIVHRSFIGLFWGFVMACLCDINALLTQKLDREEKRMRLRCLTRNTCDVIVGLNNVGYLRGYGLNLTPRTIGLLGAISGFISSSDLYQASKPKPKTA